MNGIYQAALNGTLASQGGYEVDDVWLVNSTDVALSLSWLDYSGQRTGSVNGAWVPGGRGTLLPAHGGTVSLGNTLNQNYFLLTSNYSGAFAAVINFDQSGQTIELTPAFFLDPDDIGAVPQPTSQVIIPGNSPRVVVGCGHLPNGNDVGREQFWQRMPDSYTLAPGETRTVSYTVTSGMTSTSSSQQTVEASVGVSASAGWGPVSAHVSANLSASSTSFQELSLTSQTTSFNQNVYVNSTEHPQMMLVWQLIDATTIFDAQGIPQASVITGTQPVIVEGPYDPGQLPAPAPRPQVPAELAGKVPQIKSVTPAS